MVRKPSNPVSGLCKALFSQQLGSTSNRIPILLLYHGLKWRALISFCFWEFVLIWRMTIPFHLETEYSISMSEAHFSWLCHDFLDILGQPTYLIGFPHHVWYVSNGRFGHCCYLPERSILMLVWHEQHMHYIISSWGPAFEWCCKIRWRIRSISAVFSKKLRGLIRWKFSTKYILHWYILYIFIKDFSHDLYFVFN